MAASRAFVFLQDILHNKLTIIIGNTATNAESDEAKERT